MKRLVCVLALLALASSLCLALPSDIVSPRDWSYDLMSHLAATGALPGHSASEFTGQKLYTVAEMGQFAAQADTSRLSGAEVGLLRQLQIGLQDPGNTAPVVAPGTLSEEKFVLSGFLRGRVVNGPGDSDTAGGIYRATLLSPVGNSGVVGVGVSNQAKQTSLKPDAFPMLNEFFVKFQGKRSSLEIGRAPLRWGPGYTGAMLLSDNSPNFPFIDGTWDVHLGRLGPFRLQQMISSFLDSGKRHFVMTRRVEKVINPRFGVSVMEAFHATGLPKAHLLILPFYAYQHEVPGVDREFNYLASANIWVKPTARTEVYLDTVFDDLTGPFGFNKGSVPRKIGVLAGGKLKDIFGNGKTDLRLEYAFTDASADGGTYWSTRPGTQWYNEGLPIGHQIGAGGRGLFARVDHRISSKWSLYGAFSVTDRLETDPPTIDPPPTPKERVTQADLYVTYDLSQAQSLSLRISPFRVSNAGHVEGQSDKGTFTELAATLAF